MILIILGVCIAAVILGVWMIESLDWEFLGPATLTAGGVGLVISLIGAIILTICVSELSTVDARIEMYQEENTKIEAQIADVVEQYQKYETDIFTEVAPDSSISLVALYPELKADTLVQKQIEVYTENNAKIKELREEKIGGSVARWWLYFGG